MKIIKNCKIFKSNISLKISDFRQLDFYKFEEVSLNNIITLREKLN